MKAVVLLRVLAHRAFVQLGLLPFLLIGLIVLFTVLEPRFLSSGNWFNIVRQATYLMLITMGQMVVLISGHFDLSVGSTVALTSVVTGLVMTWGSVAHDPVAGIPLGIAAGLGVGVIVGLVNGLVVAIFKVTSFMVTLGMASVAFGAALLLSKGVPVVGFPTAFTRGLGTARWFELPAPAVITAALALVLYAFLQWTKWGRFIYATGGNVKAARLAGIRVTLVTASAFVICGFFASLAGVLLTARVASGEPNLGAEYVLLSIAAAVLGGTSLYGGEGRLGYVAIGVLFIVVLSNGMNLIRIESYTQQLVLGCVLIVAVITDRIRAQLQY